MARPRRPWWRVDADTDESDKLVARLPDDTARWAWFKTGCRAKTQRQMGVFGGEAHLRGLLGEPYSRYVPDLIAAGLVHVWPVTKRSCGQELRCREDYEGLARKGDLVVHDYRRMQADPTSGDRRDRWSDKPDKRTVFGRETNGKNNAPSRALSPSPSTSLESQTGGEPYTVAPGRIAEPYATLEELTNYPIQRFQPSAIRELDALVDRRGLDAVVAAARSEAPTLDPQPPAPWPLVAAIRDRLEPMPSKGGRRNGATGRGSGSHASKEDVDELRQH